MNNIPIFIINLRKSIDRKEHMQQLCKQHALDCQFIDAVYGKELDEEELATVYDKSRALVEFGRELTAGEIGVALSQKKIYQKMVDENIEKAIILEDDVTFDNSIHELLGSIENFPKDWECTLLFYHRIHPSLNRYCVSLRNRISVSKNLKIVRFIDLMDGAAGYVINLSGAKKLLSTLEEGIYKPIDNYTGDEYHINLYGLYPQVVHIDHALGLNSTLAEDRKEMWSSSKQRAEKPDSLRTFLKKIGLHALFKKINNKKLQYFYYINHFQKCLKKPKKYRSENTSKDIFV